MPGLVIVVVDDGVGELRSRETLWASDASETKLALGLKPPALDGKIAGLG